MAEENIMENVIKESNTSPASVIQKEKYNLYAPIAGNGRVGMAKFSTDDFKIDQDGTTHLSEQWKNSMEAAAENANEAANNANEAVDNINISSGQGNGSIIKKGFTTTDTDTATYIVPNSEATGDGAISLMGIRYDDIGWEGAVNGRANGKQSLNGAVSGLADGDFSATFNHKTKAYQKGSIAVNGHCESGMTETEFLAKYPSGIEPHENLNYINSWSLAFSCGERTKAKGRGSFASGFKSYAYENFSSAKGICTTADRIGQSVDGVYNKKDTDATYIIGNGWEINSKDFTTGTEPTTPEKTSEIKRFNNFYITKRGEAVIDSEKLDTFGTNYIPSLKLIQHPNGYTGSVHHPLSIWWTNDDGTTAKAELMAKDNASGTNGHVSLEYFKYRNPSGRTESAYIRLFGNRIETNKPIYANGVQLGGGSSSNSNSLLYIQGMSSYGNYEQYFALPKDFSNIKEIKIKYTLQYDSYNYNVVTQNANVIIYNDEQGFLTPTLSGLRSNAYDDTTTYDVSTRWNTDGIAANIFVLDFYNATGGGYGGQTTYILFEIQYK